MRCKRFNRIRKLQFHRSQDAKNVCDRPRLSFVHGRAVVAVFRWIPSSADAFPNQFTKMQQYVVERDLAPALYGKVLLCLDTVKGERVAVKRMEIAAASTHTTVDCKWRIPEDTAMEKHVNWALRRGGGHPHILGIRADFVDGDSECFVFDYCGGGELYDALQHAPGHRFDLATARMFLGQIARGVSFLHRQGVAHRDLSLENVLLDATQTHAYICDFGLAVIGRTSSFLCIDGPVGKPFYIAPEVAAGRAYDSTKADVWSVGVMFYMMATGRPLVQMAHHSDDRFRYLASHGLCAFLDALDTRQWFDDDAVSLLQLMLHVDPHERASVDQVLRHPFLRHHTQLSTCRPRHNSSPGKAARLAKSIWLWIAPRLSSRRIRRRAREGVCA
ncbi:Aste57867_8976 [Aphanomyces stellatus]|uniref:Aste57867_8976 protein n=1 Tax=Aphanomyces stellatus TaxID=120398 RepID=A0A485KLV5_9STRA|nr:hypothetical protein As57867_008941 [Aphanomyces stellatus]VFT85860.1 Aste57867_8976 [Aphanomyces stellatus]